MKRGVLVIICVVFALVCLISNLFYYNGIENCIVAEVKSNQNIERISLWAGNDNIVYMFLPSYADLLSTKLILTKQADIVLDGKCIDGAVECGAYQLDTPYELTFRSYGRELNYKLIFVKSANVATMYINTESGSMDYIHASKDNKEYGIIRLYTANGEAEYKGEIEEIKGRGNSTWVDCEKRPYSLELKDETNLLSMGSAQKWVLLANKYDASSMRNKIVYDFADEVGLQYSPNSQWVDVYFNGEYGGLYLLCERNEIHKERVAVNEETEFLVSLEHKERAVSQNYACIITENEQVLRIHAPRNMDENEMAEVLATWQCIENAVISEDGIDQTTGNTWEEMIDAESWAKKYLIEEVFANVDGCFISQFFYSNGGKVFAGPVWDYDYAIGTDTDWQAMQINYFVANRDCVYEGYNTPWFYSLYHKKAFYELIVEKYCEEFLPLLDKLLNETLANYANFIEEAVAVDNLRWRQGKKDFRYQVEYIREYLRARISFLNKIWIEELPHYNFMVDQKNGINKGCFVMFQEENVKLLPEPVHPDKKAFLGWYYADTDLPFDSSIPITEDTEVYAKWEDSDYKRISQIIKLIPLAIIACMGVGVLIADIRRGRKGG